MKNKTFFLICCLIFLYSCQSIKDGLTGKKRENSDEFLVEKKNPLEVPPEYGVLPEPQKKKSENISESIDRDIEDLIESISDNETEISNAEDRSAEEFVLEKINKN